MPGISNQAVLIEFHRLVSDYLNLVSFAEQFREPSGIGFKSIGIRRVELIAGASLLFIYQAWEDFLENTFTRYMCGACGPSGYMPVLSQPKYQSIADAHRNLLAGQQYLKWNANSTISKAQQYFQNGEPYFTAVGSVRQIISDVETVRNRFAHRSAYVKTQFKILIRREIGYLPRGMTPGRFLRSINHNISLSNLSYIQYYANSLIAASIAVAP
ncbi:MAG: hypothetical protein AB1690_03590 [Candidatus Zixiibacteriota bacterium]